MRGFKAGGSDTPPSNIDPWLIIGSETSIVLELIRHHALNQTRLHFECNTGAWYAISLFHLSINVFFGGKYSVMNNFVLIT
jgi:hypothetical protein